METYCGTMDLMSFYNFLITKVPQITYITVTS